MLDYSGYTLITFDELTDCFGNRILIHRVTPEKILVGNTLLWDSQTSISMLHFFDVHGIKNFSERDLEKELDPDKPTRIEDTSIPQYIRIAKL